MRKTGPHELLRFGEGGCGKRGKYLFAAKAGALSVALALCQLPRVLAASYGCGKATTKVRNLFAMFGGASSFDYGVRWMQLTGKHLFVQQDQKLEPYGFQMVIDGIYNKKGLIPIWLFLIFHTPERREHQTTALYQIEGGEGAGYLTGS